jgi:UDPglucose 6-dehydrogenase
MAAMGQRFGAKQRIVESVAEVNRTQCDLVVKKVETALGGLSGKRIAVWGLSFKPNTDDVRESPALSICRKLLTSDASVRAFDPIAMPNARKVLDGIIYCESAYGAAEEADALLITTEWNEFRNVDLDKIRSLLKRPVVFDLRNILDPEKMRSSGFEYFGTGR